MTPSVSQAIPVTLLAQVDQDFLADFERLAMAEPPDVRDLIIASLRNNPKGKIEYAKGICQSLSCGLSLTQIFEVQAQTAAYSIARQAFIANTAIATVLAPKYYCSQYLIPSI